jgi:hypothetical protein
MVGIEFDFVANRFLSAEYALVALEIGTLILGRLNKS